MEMNLITFSFYLLTVSLLLNPVFAFDDLYTLTIPNAKKSAKPFTSLLIKMNLHRVSPATYLAIYTFFKKHNLPFTKPTLELVRYNVFVLPSSLFHSDHLQVSCHQDVDSCNYENDEPIIYPGSFKISLSNFIS